jgi:hypothetical protein
VADARIDGAIRRDRSACNRGERGEGIDLMHNLVADASGGELALIKRGAGLECELEQMEGRMSQGVEVDLDRYGRAASHLRRILESLGLERKPRNITPPDPLDYAREYSS